MSSKAKALVRGSFFKGIEFFVRSAVSLMLTPFIIHSLGDKTYGLWVAVGSFIGYYGLMDFGLDLAINRFISRTVGLESSEETNKVINTALVIFTIIGFIALVVSFAAAYIIPQIIKNITDVETFIKVILILGVNIAIGFPLRVFSGVLTSNIRYDLNIIIEFIKLIVRTTLIILFLRHGYGIVALAVITSILDIGGYIARYLIVRHIYKYIVLSKRYVSRAIIKSLFSYSIYVFITKIANQLRYNVDNLVIITFIGVSQVTMYSIGSRLIIFFIDFIISTIGIILPVFSQYEAVNRNDLLIEKFLLMTKISGYLSILVGGLLIIFGKTFIEIWVGKEYLFSYNILIVLLASVILNLMQTPSVQLLYGTSKHKFLTILNIGEGIANLILSVVLVKYFGIMGVALGTAVPMIIMSLFILPVYTCRVIKYDIRKYYFEVMFPIVIKSLIIFVLLWLVFNNFISANYITLVILAVPVGFLFALLAFLVGFSPVERNYFINIIISLWQKKRKNKLIESIEIS